MTTLPRNGGELAVGDEHGVLGQFPGPLGTAHSAQAGGVDHVLVAREQGVDLDERGLVSAGESRHQGWNVGGSHHLGACYQSP